MNPERSQRVYTIFEAALQCDPAGRAALLETLCGDDTELRPEVERLLADDERASRDRFLTDPSPPARAIRVTGPGCSACAAWTSTSSARTAATPSSWSA